MITFNYISLNLTMSPINIFKNKSAVNEPIQNPWGQQVATNPPQVVTQNQPFVATSSKKKITKIPILIAIVVILALLIFAAFKLLGKSKKTVEEITWWGLWENQSIVQPLISEYESTHPNVNINYMEQSKEDYRERLTNALAKGSGPDIYAFHNTWVPMFKSNLDALPASVMTATDFSQKYYPVITSDLSYGNSIIGIPIGYDAITLYINEDILNKAGKTPPTDWNELRRVARELTIKDENGIIIQSGVALGKTENVDHWQDVLALLMIQNGVNLTNPIGKNAEDALTFFTNFSTVDNVWDTTLPTSTQYFITGKLAMYFAPSWRAFQIKEANPELNFKTVPMPQVAKDDPLQPDITYATYWAQGVWSKSSKKAIAWDFLKFLSSNESLQKLYQNESAIRSFGEPYPATDMASLLVDHPVVGSIISLAPVARSWYLASRTFDGETGINTQMANYFKDAVNALSTEEKTASEALETVAQGVSQVLAQYGIVTR